MPHVVVKQCQSFFWIHSKYFDKLAAAEKHCVVFSMGHQQASWSVPAAFSYSHNKCHGSSFPPQHGLSRSSFMEKHLPQRVHCHAHFSYCLSA